jgi:hypothetical protein
MDEYIKREDALDAVLFALVGTGLQSTAIYALRDVPATDVVPKSEEGAECPTCHGTGRIGTTDWLTKGLSKKQLAEEKAKAIAEHEQHIKTEVAREIIKDLDSIKEDFIAMDELPKACAIRYAMLQIKKKYTEGKK